MLYARTAAALLEQVDSGLESHAETARALVAGGGASAADLTQGDEGFVQVLRADGSVALASSTVAGEALVSAAEAERARRAQFLTERAGVPGPGGAAARLLVGPSGDGGVLIVGASLDDRDEALAELLAQLVLVGPVALAVSSAVGYALAGAALRPVERMRAEAASVSGGAPGRRLPLPAAHDEVYRLGETLNEMIGRLEASVARERAFVADASHELRTPLAALRTEIEVALRRPRSAEEATAALRSVEEEVSRLTRLSEDLLTLARLDDGGVAAFGPVDLGELCARVIERSAARATAEGRELSMGAMEGLVVAGDGPRLEQALGNLLVNAFEHGDGAVRIAARAEDGWVEVEVRDRGAGFSEEFAGQAFERFTRGDAARVGGGAGLGLAIVAAVARAHGGSARIERPAEGGAAVVIRLPRWRPRTS